MGVAIPGGGFSEDRASGALVIDGGLRFDSRKSQRLTRTPSSAGNRKTWTWSAWVKTIPGAYSASNHKNLFSVDGGGADATRMHMFIGNASDKLQHDLHASSPRISSSVYRDVSSWYHVVVKFDSTQSTARNQIAWYINGQQIVNWDTESTITQNNDYGINGAYLHAIGSNLAAGPGQFFDGLMSQVYLIDGQALDPSYFGYTDPLTNVWRPKKFKPQATPNNGTVWSSTGSDPNSKIANGSIANVFSGSVSTGVEIFQSSSNQYVTMTTGPIRCNSTVSFLTGNGNSTATMRINGSDTYKFQAGSTTTQWWDFSFSGTITKIEFGYLDGSGSSNTFYGVKVDGVPLLDSDTTNMGKNAFYLPFDGSAPIGQDQSGKGNNWTPVNFGGSNTIEKATGALPILNTDGGGKVARVGVRTDAYYANLKLAVPFVGVATDVVQQINGNSASMTSFSANNATFAVHPTAGAPYSTGLYLNSVSDYPNINFSTGTFNFLHNQTGNGTVEFWMYNGTITTEATMLATSAGSDQIGISIQMASDTTLQAVITRGVTGSGRSSGTANIARFTWSHIAVTKQIVGSNCELKVYVNGVLSASNTSITASDLSNSNSNQSYFRIGQGVGDEGGRGWTDYYMNDLRIYDTVKYTSNFIPASTDPDIVPDSPSGVSYSSNLIPVTDGAVYFDGTGDKLNLGNSNDFNFGSGDCTVELFLYITYHRPSDGGSIIGRWENTDQSWQLTYGSDASQDRFGFMQSISGTQDVYSGSGVLSTNYVGRWVHLVGQRRSNTLELYVDGVLQGTRSVSGAHAWPGGGGDVRIGGRGYTNGYDVSGFVSNVRVTKGSAIYTGNFTPPVAPLTTTSQGAISGDVKLLCCKSNSSAAADVAPVSISVTGGAAATNFNPFTVNINTQRGKSSGYATWNPLFNNTGSGTNGTLSRGNLYITKSLHGTSLGNFHMTSGKWYFEGFIGAGNNMFGVMGSDFTISGYSYAWNKAYGIYPYNPSYVSAGSFSGTPNTGAITANSAPAVYGVAIDVDNKKMWIHKDGIWTNNNPLSGTADLTLSNSPGFFAWYHSASTDQENNCDTNFGQKPFKFPPPAGFQPLTLANTPRPTIVRPNQYVGVTTYTGTGSTRNVNVGFKPDFVWIKNRGVDASNHVYDVLRGGLRLATDAPNSEYNNSDFSSFDSNGFTVTGSAAQTNASSNNYVAWSWKAGGNSNTFNIDGNGYSTASAAGLTAGTITPSGASINTKSGFSIITYTGAGSGSNATISHGLGKVPQFMIVKKKSASDNWTVYHQSIGKDYDLYLNGTGGARDYPSWGDTIPTTSVFTVGTTDLTNDSSNSFIAYIWAEIPGFSKFGSYTGNSSTDGPVIITGFRPALIIYKRSSGSGNDWRIVDSTRGKYNAISTEFLYPNQSYSENTNNNDIIDILSNGFKLRASVEPNNASGSTYIYAAWAEAPSFNLYGAQANAR